jgi:enamine deaminase RidA (YjgF/YER057c/UK114 family)
VRIGDRVEVAGTTAVNAAGELVGASSPYEQARFIFTKIEKALAEAGASLEDVIRTRMFVTDITRWEEVARAHGEVFGVIHPVATLVEVSSLVEPGLLVEIEASAVTA